MTAARSTSASPTSVSRHAALHRAGPRRRGSPRRSLHLHHQSDRGRQLGPDARDGATRDGRSAEPAGHAACAAHQGRCTWRPAASSCRRAHRLDGHRVRLRSAGPDHRRHPGETTVKRHAPTACSASPVGDHAGHPDENPAPRVPLYALAPGANAITAFNVSRAPSCGSRRRSVRQDALGTIPGTLHATHGCPRTHRPATSRSAQRQYVYVAVHGTAGSGFVHHQSARSRDRRAGRRSGGLLGGAIHVAISPDGTSSRARRHRRGDHHLQPQRDSVCCRPSAP